MKKLLLLALLISVPSFAQLGNMTVKLFVGAPTAACSNKQFAVNTSNGDFYNCVAAAWHKVSGGGGITNSAGNNVLMKSDGTNAVAGSQTDTAGALTGATSYTVNAGGTIGSADTGTPKFTFAANSITANQPLTVSGSTAITPSSAASGDIGSATLPFQYVWLAGSSGTPGTNNFKFIGASTSGTRTVTLPDANTLIPIATQTVTIAGPTAARTYTFPDAAATVASGTGTTGSLPKFTTGASGIVGNSLADDGVTTANALTYTGTAGVRSPTFTATGTTAGFFDFPQGTTSAAVAPCNTATSICEQAPTSVTSYLINLPGAAANGIRRWANAANVVTESISELSGDASTSGSNAVTVSRVNGVGIQRVTMTADWTCGTGGTTSSCVAAGIVGTGGTPLTITLPNVTASYHWQCDGVVGQATAATANSWNVITATNAPTNLEATYSMNTAATAMTGGAITGVSATTTQVISPTWTLGGTATKMPFHIQGSIEGASASGTVVSLQLVAPTVADLVTIYRGATCSVTPF